MKYKLMLISFILFAAFVTMPQPLRGFSEARAYTHYWAMAALFRSDVLESSSKTDDPRACVAHETAAVASLINAGNVLPQEEFRWQGRVAAGQSIEIKGLNGSVRAEGSSGNQVEVVAGKRATRSNPAEVEIRVVEHAGGVTICAVYPSDDATRQNDCQPGKAGRMNNPRGNDVEVNFTVRVPAGVRFIGRTVNGEVEAARIGSDVEASTVNGSIRVSATGLVKASTVNGSINATMGSAAWTSDLEFNTVNGSITLSLPTSLSTDVRAETLNGDITSDFEMNAQASTLKQRIGKRINGTIGGGGRSLALKTVNGDIRLLRRSAL